MILQVFQPGIMQNGGVGGGAAVAVGEGSPRLHILKKFERASHT